MQKQISQVAAFMAMCNQAFPEKPTLGSPELAHLRIKLQKEEFEEMVTSLTEKEGTEQEILTSLADDICDQLYILFGTINAYGLQKHIEAAFDEVHNSNMTKAHLSEISAQQDLMYYEKETFAENGECRIARVGDVWCVYNQFGKLLKNRFYRKAELAPIIASEAVLFSQEEINEAQELLKQSETPLECWSKIGEFTHAMPTEHGVIVRYGLANSGNSMVYVPGGRIEQVEGINVISSL